MRLSNVPYSTNNIRGYPMNTQGTKMTAYEMRLSNEHMWHKNEVYFSDMVAYNVFTKFVVLFKLADC